MIADLHMHSTASDGQHTPTELVELAKQHGLEAISITDHDTAAGLAEAAQAGQRVGLKVIPGIELGAREYPSFHILGYGISPEFPRLLALCREMKEGRDSRKCRLISFLQEKGVEISIEEVEAAAGGDITGRPHFAQVMAEKGYAAYQNEFCHNQFCAADRVSEKQADCLVSVFFNHKYGNQYRFPYNQSSPYKHCR